MKKSLTALAISAALVAPAFATNGMAPVGLGQAAKGMGGASIAYPQDTLQGGNNPAGMVHLGNRMDVGIEIFMPDRGFNVGEYGSEGGGEAAEAAGMLNEIEAYSFDGTGSGVMESWFPIPEFGYNRMINDNLSVGVSVFGNGGMNTTYGNNHPFSHLLAAVPAEEGGPCEGNLFACPDVGIDLMQLFVAPTISYKVNDKLSIGASLNLIAARFSAEGLYMFGGQSSDMSALTNNGNSYAYGASLRVGMQAQLSDAITVGATYQTKANMSEFDEYAGLFPDQGTMDIPANWGVGIAIKATDKLDIAMDVMQIMYGETNAMGNSPNSLMTGAQLGNSNGPGFGWENQTVYKLGMAYQYSDDLTLRAGLNYGETPVNTEGLGFAFNTLAPGVTEKHVTLGFTKGLGDGASITGSYIRTMSKSQDGLFMLGFPDHAALVSDGEIEMDQHAFGISYNKKF
ncbi:OmpP1/FadL family transporter [Solemya velum gill symbiont]|uniref:OmpP1/FadL family transporter n=1 Tax=Solemya velum gill symbiont TaxID=2340 RepID=UPI000998DCAE|nr:outer membrane protein transport protein [Solemya velum gill symbiont]OOY51058.1 hypothetical protein BOV97_08845 [Solemya velum gill symbiont]OOY56193.1 hypothetical protein BOW00_07650 [Solemya velum gill symbiont]OOY56531.1 hypothetical protein BOV99_04085 [Solemya velum gill symbiont]OOY59577.1 hypothetical protein BOW02_08215 [Solemya velum gill symbiont]OOY63053.1 hypothetical protein BOW04_02400 [Solemya velum gill symbiont]